MNDFLEDLKVKMLQATELLHHIASDRKRRAGRSPETEHDYLRLGQLLLLRAKATEGGLINVVSNTRRPTTFQKRLAALRFTLQMRHLEILDGITEPVTAELAQQWTRQLNEQIDDIRTVMVLRCRGFVGPRARRRSKRAALGGLPPNWREQLCDRGSSGQYSDALLVAALTGCRPAELVSGIKVWRAVDPLRNQAAIHLEIIGAKVKRGQGQPQRRLTYAEDDDHPLVATLKRTMKKNAHDPLIVCIENAANFSVELRRLAASLWPQHRHAITAYCLRHQWSADAKRAGDPGAVSRGLGHLSGKTQRIYGVASQGKSGNALKPLSIEADRSVKDGAPLHHPTEPEEPDSGG